MHILQLPQEIEHEIVRLGEILVQKGWICATAESCTGGLLGASMTYVPGASAWFSGGILAYANAVKVAQLDVPAVVLMQEGAVSEACVKAMVVGLCEKLCVDVGISVSGIAGPGGGTVEKPVGTVWLGFSVCGNVWAQRVQLEGSREEIRTQAVAYAVRGVLDAVQDA